MYHYRKLTSALLTAVLVCAAAPVGVSAAGTFPLDQNLVTNPGFEDGAPGDTAVKSARRLAEEPKVTRKGGIRFVVVVRVVESVFFRKKDANHPLLPRTGILSR